MVTQSRSSEQLNATVEMTGQKIVHAALRIHQELGPCLLEKVYEVCLAHELMKDGCTVRRQVDIPIVYDGLEFPEALRLDLLVDESVIVEIKAVENINPLWFAQVISQLKLSGKELGFLINFHVPLIKQGIRRFVNTRSAMDNIILPRKGPT